MSSSKRTSAATAADESTSSSRRKGPKFDEEYNDSSADLVLISSDRVRFRVHSYVLRFISPVFRDMISGCTDDSKEIRFTDEKIERASAFRCLLKLAEGMPPAQFDLLPSSTVKATILLAKKYEAKAVTQTISNLVARISDTSPSSPFHTHHRFSYACLLDEVDTAHYYFPMAAARQEYPPFGAPKDTGPTVHVPSTSYLDPTAMSIREIEAIPPKYFYALLRAWRVRIAKPEGSWQEVADEFKKQVKLQEK